MKLSIISKLSKIKENDTTVNKIIVDHYEEYIISGHKDGRIKVSSFDTGDLLETFYVDDSPITSIAVSLDCEYIITGNYNGLIRIWSIYESKCVHTLYGHVNSITEINIESEETFSSTSDDDTYRVWNTDTGKCEYIFWGESHKLDRYFHRDVGEESFTTAIIQDSFNVWYI